MDYFPDGDIYAPGMLYDVDGFVPNNNGAYARAPSMVACGYTAHPVTPIVGALMVVNAAGTAKLYAGSASKIYQANGTGGWTERSGAVVFTATCWDGCAFDDKTILANGSSKLQVATSGTFTDITASPAGASIAYVFKNSIIALGSSSNGAAWAKSATGDHTIWTAAASNDADAGILYGGIGGPITAGCAWGSVAVAWKRTKMFLGTYIGNSDPDQEVIKWDPVPGDAGCVSRWGWIDTEAGLIFVSQRDIMVFRGGRPTSIADKIRRTWVAEAMANRSSIFLTLDEAKNHVYFWVKPSGATSCTRIWVYNYKTDQWGRIQQINHGTAGPLMGGGLVPVRNANYIDFIALGGTANSAQICNLVIESESMILANMAGTNYDLSATMQTGHFGMPERETTVHKVHVVPDSLSSIPDGLTLKATMYPPGKATSKIRTGLVLRNNQFFEVVETAQWFDFQITAPDTAGPFSVARLAPEVSVVKKANDHQVIG